MSRTGVGLRGVLLRAHRRRPLAVDLLHRRRLINDRHRPRLLRLLVRVALKQLSIFMKIHGNELIFDFDILQNP